MIPNDLHYDIIFSDFMMSSKIDVSLDKLKEEIYQLKTNLTHSCTRSGRNSFNLTGYMIYLSMNLQD